MLSKIVVVCKCPICCKTYRQEVRHKWTGKTWRPRRYEVALHALCVEYRQGTECKPWAGLAYCADCSMRQCPPAIRAQVEKWTRDGEIE